MTAPSAEPGGAIARGERAWPWIESGLLALVVLAVYALGGEAVRASYHGYLHTTIGEAVLREGLLPENPYHAGAPLRYYTFYPALGVLLGRIGFGPLWGFALLNGLAALLLGPSLDALGRCFGLRFRARRAAFLAAVLGFNGLGWIGLLVEPAGSSPSPVFALMPMTFVQEPFGWDARLQAFLPKYLNVSSFAIALPFALWALAAAGGSGHPARPARAIVPAALALALNPLVGGFVGIVLAAWTAPLLVRGSLRERSAWPLAGLVALALASPFVISVLQPAQHGASLLGKPALGGSPVSNLVGPLLVLIPAGLAGLARFERALRWRWLAAAALAAAIVLTGEMPHGNEYKFARLGALLWALPAGAWIARSRGAMWALALLCAPTSIAAARAYVAWVEHAPPLPLRAVGGRLAPDPSAPGRALDASILAAEAASDPAAILIVDPADPAARTSGDLVQGNALAPALHHALYVDRPQIHNDGLPDLERRLAIVEGIYRGDLRQAAAQLGSVEDRSWLLLARASGERFDSTLAELGWKMLARARDTTLWSHP